ncbi:alpha/beta fold hydrolase [Heyndrickxia acidicola]|uniref:Alpha/beta hydrolase n=1 Tax=Heyndrickxia acidicola TaxID=209389 RepID=A0ABU6MI99_9BACI|nr:alpha/beta hydrolase [Heyndrickxia acidicola]MED1204123.1 alpha/beta hydrolase [Heyndrickxia acidicola]
MTQEKTSSIHVYKLGEGEPLVFLHGGPGGEHRFFLPHMEPLKNDFQLIFYDQTGCGQSAPLQDHSSLTMRSEVEKLEDLRQQWGIQKLNLIGESWGSMLALLYTAAYPKHVNKLLLTAAIGLTYEGFESFEKELTQRLSSVDQKMMEELLPKLADGSAEIEELFKILDPYYVFSEETLKRKTPTIASPHTNEVLNEDIKKHYDLRPFIPILKEIPIMVVQGDHDLITPEKLQELFFVYLPEAGLKVIKNCGHWALVEKPEEFMNEVRAFFKS